MSNVVFDEILGKVRAGDVNSGGGGGGGSDLIAGNGLTIAGGTASVAPGYRLNTSAGTVNQDRFFPIETVSGASVTLQAGHAYIINATTSAGITLNCESFAANTFGLEGHATIYTANAGYVQQGANVYLADPLEPDAVNNCTIRFHGGSATVSVEDYFGGYIVLSGGTDSGSLPYGLASAGSQYIGFNASLNGQTLDLSGSTANGEKHIVGNGYSETILTGAVNCGSSSFTVANLSLSDVQVTGGVMTLGDAWIPPGSTVAVATSEVVVDGVTTTVPLGSMAIEKVVGAGSDSVIDLGGTHIAPKSGATVNTSNVLFSGGVASAGTIDPYGGVFYLGNNVTLVASGCIFTGNDGNGFGGVAILGDGCDATFVSCTESANTGTYGLFYINGNARVTFSGCVTTGSAFVTLANTNARAIFSGSNSVAGRIAALNASGSVTLTSGAILDLSGNTNPTPIAPGGGITFESGGATVYPFAGSSAAVNVNISGGAFGCSTITNGGVLVMPSAGFPITDSATLSGNATINVPNQSVIPNATFSGVTFSGAGHIVGNAGATITFSNCTVSVPLRNRTDGKYGNYVFAGNCTVDSVSNDSGFTSGTVTLTGGAVLNLTGNNNATPIAPGGVVIGSNVQIYPSAGSVSAFTVSKGFPCVSIQNSGVMVMPYPAEFESRLKPTVYRNTDGTFSISVIPASLKLNDSSGTSVVWVATDGNDANAGTEQSPLATLTAALANGAVTIYIKAGTYILPKSYNLAGHNVIASGGAVTLADDSDNYYCYIGNGSAYLEGITFDVNSKRSSAFGIQIGDSDTVCLNGCSFINSTSNGVNALGGNIYLFNCSAHDNGADGFNYSNNSTSFANVAEVNCTVYDNGNGSHNSDNASTMHNGGSIVRVNGTYYNCHGGVVADISASSSEKTRSCNYGCYAYDSTGTGSYSACFWASTFAEMWLYCCRVAGSDYELSASGGAKITSYALDTDRDTPDDYNDGTATIIRS